MGIWRSQLLIENGANVNLRTRDKSQITPLHKAAYLGHLDVAQLLIDRGANINAKFADDKYTPLMLAAEAGHYDMVCALLKRGADPKAVGIDKVETRSYSTFGDSGAARRQKAKISRRKVTAASIAEKGGHSEITDLLNRVSTTKIKKTGFVITSLTPSENASLVTGELTFESKDGNLVVDGDLLTLEEKKTFYSGGYSGGLPAGAETEIVSGGVEITIPKGTKTNNSQANVWSVGVRHRYIGEVGLENGYKFYSNPDEQLVFEVGKAGYRHVGGSGVVLTPDNSILVVAKGWPGWIGSCD